MQRFEAYLEALQTSYRPSRTRDAMFYSLLAGGKRVRPRLLLALLKGYGKEESLGYPCAAAIEMVQGTVFRSSMTICRPWTMMICVGAVRPVTSHLTRQRRILAGDALLSEAFGIVMKSECSAEIRGRLVELLSAYAGVDGMILGQTLDIAAERQPVSDIEALEEDPPAQDGEAAHAAIAVCSLAGRSSAGHREHVTADRRTHRPVLSDPGRYPGCHPFPTVSWENRPATRKIIRAPM